MKYLLFVLLFGMSFWATAQPGGNMEQNKNPLLNQSFWKTQPDVNAVKAEINKGNSPSEMNSMSMDPVVIAINAGAPNESIIYLLQQSGNDLNKLTHDGRTYLFWAASRGNTVIMDYLLTRGAHVNEQDSHGMTPLTFAATAGQKDTKIFELLAQKGVNLKTDVTGEGANALLLSAGNDSAFKLTDYFISKGLSLKSKDAAGNTAFDYAARSGNIGMMKALADKGITSGGNAMLMAAQGTRGRSNGIEVYQYLESIGIKPTTTSKTGENVLHAIVRKPGQPDVIKYFLSKGVDVNQTDEEGNTVLMNAAASNRDTTTPALLLPSTKNINQKNKAGATALMLAVKSNAVPIVEYLINNGSDVQTTDAKGNNLVYYLFDGYNPRQSKDIEPKLKLLQSKGLNVTAPQKDGSTMYHLAAAKNELSLVELVHNYNVDVNAKSKEGLTALHKAAMMSKNSNIMEYLISIGADKNIKTGFNETAFELASENEVLTKNKVAVDFLK